MNDRCWLCDINKITSKRRPLCESCYSHCKAKKLLHIFPITTTREETIRRLILKYGKGFIKDLFTLKEDGFTLSYVGNKYGLSRERIRQIYNALHSVNYGTTYKLKLLSRKLAKQNIKSQNEIGG
jgi:hypothetical protein